MLTWSLYNGLKCGAFCSIQSLWIVSMYHTQTRAPWQTLMNSNWSHLEHFHHNVIHNDRFSYTTTLNLCDFVTSKRPEFPGFLYYFNSFLAFILSRMGGNFASLVFSLFTAIRHSQLSLGTINCSLLLLTCQNCPVSKSIHEF